MNPLKNEYAELVANKISEVFDDRNQANYLYQEFLKINPTLKYWESLAIADRARYIYNQKKGQIL